MSVSIPAKRFASYIKLIPGIESMDECDIVKKFDEFEKAAGALRKAEKTRLESLSEEERAAEKEMKKKEAADKKQAEKAKKAAEREAKLRAEKGDEAFEAARAKRIASLAKAREAKKRLSGNAEPAEEVEKQEEKQEETEKPNEKQLIYDEIGDGSDEEEPEPPKITNIKPKKTSKPKVNKSAK